MSIVKDMSPKYIKFFIYLVVIVLLNGAGMTLFFRIDLTKNNMNSLSEASKKVVSTLSEPLTVKVFFTQNLPAPHNNTERYLRDLLAEYALHANRYFNYRFFNVTPEAEGISQGAKENQKLAKNYGIRPVQIQVVEKDEVKFKKAYMGLVLIHGDMIERVPAIASTDGLEYEVTMAIMKLNNKISALLSLPDKIQIKLYLSSALKNVAPYAGLKDFTSLPEKLEGIVRNLNDKTYGKLDFTSVDPATMLDIDNVSEKYNLMTLKWPAIPARNINAGKGVIGLVMKHGNKVRTIQLLNVARIPFFGTQYDLVDTEKIGQMINNNLESLIGINQDVGYLADHGTLQISRFSLDGNQNTESLSSFSTLVSRNYSIRHVKIKDRTVPESLQSLVIARPTENFTDYELYQIDQALMRGTNLAIFLDAFKEIVPKQNRQTYGVGKESQYVPLDTGLERLLGHYGLSVKKSFVLDENSYSQQLPRRFGGGERLIYYAPIIKSKFINNKVPFMKDIKALVTMKISPLEPDEQQISKNGLKARRLFASSEKSWEMSRRINLNPMSMRPPASNTDQESMPLAYLLEGEFPSYFAGKPMPEKKTEDADSQKTGEKESLGKPSEKKMDIDLSRIEGKGAFRAKGKQAKIFLIGSSAMIRDNLLDPEGKSPNAMFILNVLDALNNREDIAAMRTKVQRFNPLYETGGLIKTIVKTFNIVGLPILVIIFGLFVWLRRYSRKKRIRMMFQK